MEKTQTLSPWQLDNALHDTLPMQSHKGNKLAKLRNSRDLVAVEKALQAVREGAAGDSNLFPLVIDALKQECTLGEIVSAMKDIFGTWMAPSGF